MLRPLSLLPALLAAVALVVGVGSDASAESAAPADPDAPLAVTIATMSPSAVPDKGRITVRGTVTNLDDETWTSIEMYPFVSESPMTTRAEIAQAATTDPTAQLGGRITIEGPYATIGSLEPGQSASYTVRVRAQDLQADEPGVYWFGVHALGESPSNPEGVVATADGRARTFLPRLNGTDRQVKTALVLPLRASISYDADGSIADPAGWADQLSSTGRLGRLAAFGEAAGSRPLTWLLDPAVTDAASRLAAQNPARSLAATLDPDATEDPDLAVADPEDPADPAATPSAEPGAALPSTLETAPAEGDGSATEAPEPSEDDADAARSATSWLGRVRSALTGTEILTLPYGDLDVSAAARHDATAYTRARERSGDTLQPWGLPTSPSLSSPRGYLDLSTLQLSGDDETLLGSDQMVPRLRSRAPTVVTVDGRRVVLASTAAASGGPGPDDPMAGVAVRQRILAEVAVRRMTARREPLVVVLPSSFLPADAAGFFEGLDQPWLDLTTVGDIADDAATPIASEDLAYPRFQARRELDGADFESANALTRAGTSLQYLLSRNDTVGHEVADQAMTSLSYAHRLDAASARAGNDASRAEIESSLRGVTIRGPRQVTLSSASGRFSATLENTLDEPVTVRVKALAEEPITITMAEEDVRLPANSRRSVLFTASTERQGIHRVTLQVTDMAGTPLGSSDGVPIRAAQVSDVIWLIIGTGAALLFGAIGVRLARRIRAARRTPSDAVADDLTPEAEAAEEAPTPA